MKSNTPDQNDLSAQKDPLLGSSGNEQDLSEAEKKGAKMRKRTQIISIVCAVIFFAALIWLLMHGGLTDTDTIKATIQKAGVFGPLLYILIYIFTSYIPIIPLGSMGSIGIVLFGMWPAFFYNSIVSIINCLLAYWLAHHYGWKIILWFASPQTVRKYQGWLAKFKHFDLIFAILMFMPVSPDLVLCMIAGLMNMKLSHFIPIILISRPFSSWCYSTGLLKIFEGITHAIHL